MTGCCVLQNGAGSGSGAFGSMPMGSKVTGSPIGLCSATPITANEVRVCIDGEVEEANPCKPNSPANRKTWKLIPLNPGICTRLVQRVILEGECLTLVFDGPLCCGEPYRVTNTLAQVGCDEVDFTALCIDPKAKESDVRSDDGFLVDIANPFLPGDAQQKGAFLALGTYEITDTGDLAKDRGISSLRKRIYRRIATAVDQFFHLKGYGSELEIKALVKPDRISRLQEKLRTQILREPEVFDVQVSISRVNNNPEVLSVSVRAVTAGGATIGVNAPISIP